MDNGVFKNKLIRAQSLKYEKIDFYDRVFANISQLFGKKAEKSLVVI